MTREAYVYHMKSIRLPLEKYMVSMKLSFEFHKKKKGTGVSSFPRKPLLDFYRILSAARTSRSSASTPARAKANRIMAHTGNTAAKAG